MRSSSEVLVPVDCNRRQGLRHNKISRSPSRGCIGVFGRGHWCVWYGEINTMQYWSYLHAAGQNATDAFYGLHRHEVITRPQYARLQIGVIDGEESIIQGRESGQLSQVPYAEPTWLSDGYYSPYYKEVCVMLYLKHTYWKLECKTFITKSHRTLQKAMRKFVDEIVYPDAQVCWSNSFNGHLQSLNSRLQAREEDGKQPSLSVIQAMAWVVIFLSRVYTHICSSDQNIHAMRMGPGKHLKGLQLLGGVKPEEVSLLLNLSFTAFSHHCFPQVRLFPRGWPFAPLEGQSRTNEF